MDTVGTSAIAKRRRKKTWNEIRQSRLNSVQARIDWVYTRHLANARSFPCAVMLPMCANFALQLAPRSVAVLQADGTLLFGERVLLQARCISKK